MHATHTFPRDALATAIQTLVDLLDRVDGDSDLEPNGDELDGQNSEDEFILHSLWNGGAGCPIADPGGCEHDGREQECGF